MNKTLESYINDNTVLNIYMHGSRVYGTHTEQSDYDYIVVMEDDSVLVDVLSDENCDFNFYRKSEWIEMCKENDIDFCECYFLPDEFKVKETFVPDFKVNVEKLRSSFSKTASNSFVKCKKKLTVEKDFVPYVGKKSLWHSLRILMFGIQILADGKIVDYSCANRFYKDIVENDCDDWQYFKEKYQPIYNSLKSSFRAAEKLSQ